MLLLILLVSSLAILPLIEIDEFSTAPGMIRPDSEPIRVKAGVSGVVERFVPEENSYVHAGDTLVVLSRVDLKVRDSLLGLEIDSLCFRITHLKNSLVILSPASGFIRYFQGARKGSYVTEGDPIVEIIPKSDLIVKCYVDAEDIGLVRHEQEVFYRMKALNRIGAGPLKGKVISISRDVTLDQGHPVFEVHCSLDTMPASPAMPVGEESTAGPNPEYLRSGMTLIARFRLARRTVFDLLLDKGTDTELISL